MRAQVDFWRERLADPPAPLALAGAARPAVPGDRGERLWVDLPPALPDQLREFCRREGVSLFTVLLTAYAALLGRLAGTGDLCVGSAVANRRFSEVEPVLGMFVNNIVLRCDVSGDPTFRDLVRRTQQVVLDATANQDVPFSHLVRQLRPPRRGVGNPYFQVMFSFHDSQQPDLDFAGSPATLTGRHSGAAKADLDVVVLPMAERQTGDSRFRDSRISLVWEYSFDVFDRPAVDRLVAGYHRLLTAAVAAPDTPIGRLP
jgi:non-ribosomal peptide synthetase component F